MDKIQYKSAPITEAVFEIRYSASCDEKREKKGLKELKKFYSQEVILEEKTFKLEISKPGVEPKPKITGEALYQLSCPDMTDQIQIRKNSFSIIRLAPYTGWSDFRDRIIRDWDIWQKNTGFQEVKRVGMRYINRIDIPLSEGVTYNEQYVSVFPSVPEFLGPGKNQSIDAVYPLLDLDAEIRLKWAVVNSPLPKHISLMLDLDIIKAFKDRPNTNEIFEFADAARMKKNEIFEACITDKARELFNK